MTQLHLPARLASHLCGALTLSVALASPLLHAQPTEALALRLPEKSQGAAAINALGAHLPAVAKAYGLDPQKLATLLTTHPSLAVDRSGALLYLCDALGVPANAPEIANGTTTSVSLSTATSTDSSDALRLHSLPGAPRVIYLDFDGHTTSGTSWNSLTGTSSIVSAPFDLDGNPSSFSAEELSLIKRVWQLVAEDYAPFGVNVTTQDPGLEALRKTSSSDGAYGVRVVISPTNFWGGGGVAYVGSFNWSSDTPAFVFPSSLGNWDKAIAECASHESGHTLGLYHSGASGTEYYTGHGNWAPIMGVGFYKSVTQWSRGEYAGATSTQDQIAVMQNYGATLLGDDHGNSLSTASTLAGPNVADGGTLETRTDVDVFRFDTGAGAISLTIKGVAPESNINLRVELLDATGRLLLATTPSTLGTTLTPTLAAGTYFLRLDGLGDGDPATTGYSDYGSLGNYVILGTLVGTSVVSTTTKQAPVASASATPTSGTAPLYVQFTGQNSYDADGTIVSYHWDFGNGVTSTAVNPTYTYSSAGSFNAVLTVKDNDGLTASATIVISVSAQSNTAPVAVASASTTSGVAPLPVTFYSAGSYDPDGTIASYRWDFGDGTSSSDASPSKTYNSSGTYTVRLTVTDNSGATGSATLTVSVSTDGSSDFDIRHFSLRSDTAPKGTTVTATVIVRDRYDRPVAGAAVTIAWSGVLSGTKTATTDANGQVTLASGHTKKKGTVTATITSVVASNGGKFDDTIYSEPLSTSVPIN